MKRTACAILVLALTALAVTGCAPAAPTAPSSPTAPQTPGATSTPATTPPQSSVSPTATAPTTKPVAITVYFEYREKMQSVSRTAPSGTRGVLLAAIKALLAGPTKKERAAGLGSEIPSGARLRGVSIADHVATIDLTSRFDSGSGALSMTNRLAQVVFTATQFPSVGAVKLSLNGKVVTVFGSEGIMLDHAQTRKDYEDSTPAIFVDSPGWGGALTEGALLRGTANVFEATLRVQLRDSFGTLLFDTTVKASSGTGTRGDWTAKVTLNHSTAHTGKLKVWNVSAKNGKPEHVLVIPVLLKP